MGLVLAAVFLSLVLAPAAAVAGTISGSVTDAASSDPLVGVMVDVFHHDGLSGEWIADEFASTDASGAYTIAGLADGEYRVGFNAFGDVASLSSVFWQARADIASADTIALSGDVTAVDATLSALPVSLEGTVTAEGSGEPLADVVVTAYRLVAGEWEVEDIAFSGADGAYRLYGVAPGAVRVGFDDPWGIYAPEYYDDAAAIADADDVIAPRGGVSAALAAWVPSVAGTVVRDSGGQPIPDAVVTAFRFDTVDEEWVALEQTATATDGSWVFYGLGSGDWRFGADDPSDIHAPRFYDRASALADAKTVTTTAGTTINGISIPLIAQNPSLTGSVTDSVTATPIRGCEVDILRFDSGTGEWISHMTTSTVGDGSWQAVGLYDGTWRVFFNAASASNPDYFEQYFSQTRLLSEAQSVNTVTGATLSGVSVRMVPRVPSVVGIVTRDGSGETLPGIRVRATRVGDPTSQFTTMTAGDGSYSLKALPSGAYRIRFDDPSGLGGVFPYRTEYFDNRSLVASADAVSIVETMSATVSAALANDETNAPRVRVTAPASALRTADVSIVATEPATESGISALSYSVDGGATQTAPVATPAGLEASVTVTFSTYGTHTVRYVATDYAGNTTPASTLRVTVTAPTVTRVSGADRFEVAVAVARSDNPTWSQVNHVVIASGEDRASADPLAAAGLCWAYERAGRPAPLLLTSSGNVAPAVERAIAEIVSKNTTVTLHVVGGSVSVPSARVTEIRTAVAKQLGLTASQAAARIQAERVVATGSRYDLAAAIADRMVALRGAAATGTVIFANGADPARFYDALAVTPISARRGAPVLLVSSNSVSAATVGALKRLGTPPSGRFVAGGPSTVSPAVLERLSVPAGNRMAGADRYATAAAVARRAIDEGWLAPVKVGVAARIPDALTGGVSLGGSGGVMLFTDTYALPQPTRSFLESENGAVDSAVVFGGTLSVSSQVVNAIASVLD